VKRLGADDLKDSTPLRGGLLTAFLCFMFFAIVENSQQYEWIDWYAISREGQKIQAEVKTKQESSRTCFFEYMVNSKRYEIHSKNCSYEIG
jgi:hypothetical protein